MLHGPLTDLVIETFYQVYNELGHGYLESVYARAMTIALREVGLRAEEQLPIAVHFRGWVVGEFRADMIVERCVLLELKACRAIEAAHEAQLLHYLRATTMEVGLVLNFGTRPSFKRLIFTNDRKLVRGGPAAVVGPSAHA